MPNVKKYPIIGGPLDGLFANKKDFYRGYTDPTSPHYNMVAGQFEPFRKEYVAFNAAADSPTSMLFLHVDLLSKPVRAPQTP